ncbi:hypothetical protein O5D80_005357 [Batrachochytrium dendrobatidis]|nr:hypothetical protein O5D80_005357 [Batrachochytrium dendrobatidis]
MAHRDDTTHNYPSRVSNTCTTLGNTACLEPSALPTGISQPILMPVAAVNHKAIDLTTRHDSKRIHKNHEGLLLLQPSVLSLAPTGSLSSLQSNYTTNISSKLNASLSLPYQHSPAPPTSLQTPTDRLKKSNPVILSGSHIRPKPRPPQLPLQALSPQHDPQIDLDDEPSMLSELIRGPTNSAQDPYNTFFDDITGWEEDTVDDIVSCLLNTSSSASYKYLTYESGPALSVDEPTGSPNTFQKKLFRRKPPPKTSNVKNPFLDLGEETSTQANAEISNKNLGTKEDADIKDDSSQSVVSTKANNDILDVPDPSTSIPTLDCIVKKSKAWYGHTNSNTLTQHQTKNIKQRPATCMTVPTNRNSTTRTQQQVQRVEMDDDQFEAARRQYLTAKEKSQSMSGSSNSLKKCGTPPIIDPSSDVKLRTRTSTPKRNTVDLHHTDLLETQPIEKIALMRKKLISSATTAKVHWRSSQVVGNGSGAGTIVPLDLTGITVITGRKYHKAEPASQSSQSNDINSQSTQRPKTAAAVLSQSRRDKPMLPRISSALSVHITPGEVSFNPIIKGLGSSKIASHISVYNNKAYDMSISDPIYDLNRESSSGPIQAHSQDVHIISNGGYYIPTLPQQHQTTLTQVRIPVWCADTSPTQYRSASLDRFTATIMSAKIHRKSPKKLSQYGFQQTTLPLDVILPVASSTPPCRVDTMNEFENSISKPLMELKQRPASTIASNFIHRQRHSQVHELHGSQELSMSQDSVTTMADLQISKAPCINTTPNKPKRSFRSQVNLNRLTGKTNI